MYHLSRGEDSVSAKIFLYFVATARFLLGSIPWMSWLGLLDYSPQDTAQGVCVYPFDAYQTMATSIAVPLLFVAEMVGFGVIHGTVIWCATKKCGVKKVPRSINFHLSRYVTAVLSLLLSSYTSITGVVLEYLNCYSTEPGQSVIWNAPAISCQDPLYRRYLVGIGVLLAFPVIGLPCVLLPLLLWLGRTRRLSPKVYKAFAGIVYQSYKDRYFWWEIVACLRRLALVGLSIAFFDVRLCSLYVPVMVAISLTQNLLCDVMSPLPSEFGVSITGVLYFMYRSATDSNDLSAVSSSRGQRRRNILVVVFIIFSDSIDWIE